MADRMTDDRKSGYTLTVRPGGRDPGWYEYVVSRRGHAAVRSTTTYATYEAAKAAGDEQGRALAAKPEASTVDD